MINWTDAMTAELTSRYLSGESYDRIGRAMRVSRNAVAGKIDRLELRPLTAVVCARPVIQERPAPSMPRLKWLDNYSIA